MTNNDNDIRDDADYSVVSVEKTTPPSGAEGGSWYQYVVGRGSSSLVCKRSGTLEQVTEHAENLAVDLNSRRGTIVSQYSRQGSKRSG